MLNCKDIEIIEIKKQQIKAFLSKFFLIKKFNLMFKKKAINIPKVILKIVLGISPIFIEIKNFLIINSQRIEKKPINVYMMTCLNL